MANGEIRQHEARSDDRSPERAVIDEMARAYPRGREALDTESLRERCGAWHRMIDRVTRAKSATPKQKAPAL